MKKKIQKLGISRETIRLLDHREVSTAAGGRIQSLPDITMCLSYVSHCTTCCNTVC